MENSSPNLELVELMRLRAKDLANEVAPVFTINSRQYELISKAVYLLNRAASIIENGESKC